MSIKTVDQIKSSRANPQFNFSQKQILSIVAEVSNGLSRKEACTKYGMAYGTVGAWMKRYGPGAKKAQVPNHKKREVVRAVTEGRMTVKEAQLACNVLSPKKYKRMDKANAQTISRHCRHKQSIYAQCNYSRSTERTRRSKT